MARPQKFRLTPDEVLEPQHARKLAGHVSEIEFFRQEIEKLQQQVAGIYDAADEDGFDKKFVRKAVAKRAKDSSVLAAEEQGLEAYEMAIEKGMATRARERNSKNDDPDHDPETGEITEPLQTAATIAIEAVTAHEPVVTSSVENEAAEISTLEGEAQKVERRSPKPEDAGSIPATLANPTASEMEVVAGSSNGRTAGFDPVNAGSTPAPAPKFDARSLRPHCLNPFACGAMGRDHCFKCKKAMEEEEAA